MKKSIYSLLIIFIIGCASAKLVTPAQTDVDRVKDKFPNYTLAELNHGKTLFEQHCGQCHGLKNPASHSEEQWRKIVPKMVKNVNKKENNVLTEKDQDEILKYVITMSSAPKVK